MTTLTEAEREALKPQVRSYIESLERRYTTLEVRYNALDERHRLLVMKRFGRSSEKGEANQPTLFTEAEDTAKGVASDSSTEEAPTVSVATHERKKAGRKAIDPSHPRIEVTHDIPEQEKHCGCGHELVRIGEETREILQVIPEQIWVERHVYPKYACTACEGSGDEDLPAVRIADREPSLIARSISSASLLAFILVNKFIDHLPFYRQEQRFARIGIAISRQDMSNWAIATAKALAPLIALFTALIRGGPVINIDETPLQVHGERGRKDTTKSYMWLACGGPRQAPVAVYSYSETRSSAFPRTLLDGYRQFVQADAYLVYLQLAKELGFILVGCFAHARRHFVDAAKASRKGGAANEAIKKIRELYKIEHALREQQLDDETFVTTRREMAEPVLAEFRSWLEKKAQEVVPGTLLGKAVAYTLGEWPRLIAYLDHAALTPDNNAAERLIRPFVMGRRQWLFSGSPRGAEASCTIYSLVQTAKMNGLNPFHYLHYVISRAPYIRKPAEWQEFLPQNLTNEILTAALPDPLKPN